MTSIIDLGNSINSRSAEVLSRMVAFGQVAADQTVTVAAGGNDVSIGSYTPLKIKNFASSGAADYGIENADGTRKAATALTETEVKALDQFTASGQTLKYGEDVKVDMIANCLVKAGDTVLAGGMVELQAKIDAMLSTVQMSIKNGGQVSQTLQAAARG